MIASKLLVIAAIGLAAGACSASYETTQAVAPVVYPSAAGQVCIDYGFQPGTDSYNRCVVREADARVVGRMPRDYGPARLTADAQLACSSYGLLAGTATYERCVAREVEARRYQEQAAVVTRSAVVYTAPSGPAVVYSSGPVDFVPAAPSPPAGVEAFRDEYGFRYDGLGNRIDRNGNIISPQSTTP
jgi:hypothetical protein